MSYRKEIESNSQELLLSLGLSKQTVDCAEFTILGARKLVRFHRSRNLGTILKIADRTLQTKADRISEAVIGHVIAQKYPQDLITGEENGTSGQSENGRRWIFDPLDGTGIYKMGLCASSTTVLVEDKNRPQACAICDPFLHELLVCQPGLIYQFGLDENLVPTGKSIEKITMPQPEGGKVTVFVDTTLRKTTAGPLSALISRLPYELNADITLLSTGSNVNNQRQAVSRGNIWLTDAIGGEWDVRSGAFATEQAGGLATDINGNPVTSQTRAVAIGSCSPELHAKILPLVQHCYDGYVDYKTGVI